MAEHDLGTEFDIHHYQWFCVNSPQNDNYCILCNKILKEPMLTECCGAHICRSCAEPNKVYKNLYSCNECPNCSQSPFVCILDKPKWKNILELQVYCPLKERGCTWKGDIRASQSHLAADCEYMDFDCINGCGESLERHEISEHLEKLCSKRPSTCQFCEETGEYDIIQGDHLYSCPEQPIACPNGCGEHFKQAQHREHKDQCPESLIPCDFNYAGCDTYLRRKFMQQHLMEELQQHLQLQAALVRKRLNKSDQKFQKYAEESEKMFDEYLKRGEERLKKIQEADQLATLQCARKMELRVQEECQKSKQIEESWKQMHEHQERRAKQMLKQFNMLWELDRTQLQFDSKITSGQFSEVWRGMHYGEEQVAIKKHKTKTTTLPNFLQEAFFMREFEHSNLIQLCGVSTSGEPALIVTEYMSHGNLLDYLRNQGGALPLAQQVEIIRQVATGMAYLESSNCIHRSLTSRSILVSAELSCKIGSFTSARILAKDENEYKIPQGERVPIKWSAPEVLINNKFSIKSDVWSFGILQYEVMTCEELKMSRVKAESFIRSGENLRIPLSCPDALNQIMSQCWSKKPNLRPAFDTLTHLIQNLKL